MTRMLASVMSVDEVRPVMHGGADIIDIKDPLAGALGALPTDQIRQIVTDVRGRRPCSATIGDIAQQHADLRQRINDVAGTGVDFVKVGLFDTRPSSYFLDVLADMAAKKINIVVVLFAEDYRDDGGIAPLCSSGIAGLMLDTRNKNGKNLRAVLADTTLGEFIHHVRQRGVMGGLAGSLTLPDIPPLLKCKPDYLGFRGALCAGNDRIMTVDSDKIAAVREHIPIPVSDTIEHTQQQSSRVNDNGTMA